MNIQIPGAASARSLTLQRITAAVESACVATFPEDPLLTTALSRLTSVCGSVVKRHGPLLEGAIADALESSGRYVVLRRMRLPVTAEGRALVTAGRHCEEVRTLDRIESWADADLVVVDERTGHLLALQIKRGGGKTDAKKRRLIERDLLAARTTCRAYFAQQSPELDVRSCEVRIVDVYGGSGFDPAMTILGTELDMAFELPIAAWITATTSTLRAALEAVLPELVEPVLATLGAPAADGVRPSRSRADLLGIPQSSEL
ncbi:hypothetical protein [Salinarimonas ramus]|uniref:Uncharacterized protein n=1 Tax=Salinarimonas ramus TaxID=690164 RepID=A0A917QGD3_9HYPH|nr:hypothetical protein [Salinarimonas ramus]GGK47689.1 hypothetical protein GCM10011322_38420 [Salinarimonas ramus]